MQFNEKNYTKLCYDRVNNPAKLQKLLTGRQLRPKLT